jgi:hypothetical protein
VFKINPRKKNSVNKAAATAENDPPKRQFTSIILHGIVF